MSSRGQTSLKAVNKAGQQPTKQVKRNNSEISNDSSVHDDSLTMHGVQTQLDLMSQTLKDLRENIQNTLKKQDIEKLVQTTVNKIVETLEKSMRHTIETRIKEETKEIMGRVESYEKENEMLREKIKEFEERQNHKLQKMQEQLCENEKRSIEANIRSNQNEQYSRKNNVKIMDVPTEDKETIDQLTTKVINLFGNKSIPLQKEEILAIHRIPSKKGGNKPVIIKTTNNNVKTRLMKGRKSMKEAGYRLADDVTVLNSGLISRLLRHPEVENAWFFNGSVYGQTKKGRIKFQIYDNIDSTIQQHGETFSNRFNIRQR